MTEFLYDMLVNCAFAVTIAMVWWLHGPKQLSVAALGAAFGFLVYRATLHWVGGIFFPTLLSATVIGVCAELSSRWIKTPAIVLLAPGIYTLVPGSRLYETMLFIVTKHYDWAWEKGLEVILIGAGIALGVLAASLLSASLRRARRKNIVEEKGRPA